MIDIFRLQRALAQPRVREHQQVLHVGRPAAIEIAGDSNRGQGQARLRRAPVGAHIDSLAMRPQLGEPWDIRIAGVDASAGCFILHPAASDGVPPPRL